MMILAKTNSNSYIKIPSYLLVVRYVFPFQFLHLIFRRALDVDMFDYFCRDLW